MQSARWKWQTGKAFLNLTHFFSQLFSRKLIMIIRSVFHLDKNTVNSTARQELMMRHRRRVIFSVIVTAIGKAQCTLVPLYNMYCSNYLYI
jgi:hypothetical protein